MARRRQSLFIRAFTVASLTKAWRKVRSNDGAAGGDGVSIARFAATSGRNLTALSAALLGGSYAPHDLRLVHIPKSDGSTRPLAIPSVSDRIAQTAAAQALVPVLEPLFHRYSFGYRPGRSVLQAVRTIEALRRRGFSHVVEADIQRCFERIPHDRLLALLAEVIGDEPDLVDLVALWLEQVAQEQGTPGRGLAQGSPLSPLLANLYLDQLDDAFDRKGLALIRFADDFVILCRSEAAAKAALADAGAFLRDHGLELKSAKTRVVDFDRGFAFLGHLFVRALVLKQQRDESGEGDEDPLAVIREIARLDDEDEDEARDAARADAARLAAGFDAGQRVLHVVDDGRRLRRRNLSFAVENAEGHELIAVAHGRVDRIELGPHADTDLDTIRHALATDTDLALIDSRGETLGLLVRPPEDRAGLHLAQARAVLDPALSVTLARALVDARLRNQRARLHLLNRTPKDAEVMRAIAAIGRQIRALPGAESIAGLRGHEGAAGALYWPALGRLCASAPAPFRRSRPAQDPLNAAINFLTALLARDIRAAMLSRGLHPGFGVLHSPADREDAGVYDLMEGFRALLTEGLAVALFNQGRLGAEMFTPMANKQGVRIAPAGRRALVMGYESACHRLVTSPHSHRRRKQRMVMAEEAGALAAFCQSGGAQPFTPALQDY